MRKIGVRQWELLSEARRRYLQFGKPIGKTLTEAWTGLGSATTYKPCSDAGLMEIATTPNPGYTTWWRLTERGARVVHAMIDGTFDGRG